MLSHNKEKWLNAQRNGKALEIEPFYMTFRLRNMVITLCGYFSKIEKKIIYIYKKIKNRYPGNFAIRDLMIHS